MVHCELKQVQELLENYSLVQQGFEFEQRQIVVDHSLAMEQKEHRRKVVVLELASFVLIQLK